MTTRRSLTPKERAAMLAEQEGQCAACRCPIGPQPDGGKVPFIAEHTLPVALGNRNKPDCLLCVPCTSPKTAEDVARIAKADRQRKAHLGLKKAQRPFRKPPEGYKTQWPSRSIPSRPMRSARNGR